MATKQQVVRAIQKKWPGATLSVVKVGSNVNATIYAPDGFYLSGFGHHFLCLEPCCNSAGRADCEFLDENQREEYWSDNNISPLSTTQTEE